MDLACVVLDNGSGSIKAGFAGDGKPSVIHDSLYSTSRARAVHEARSIERVLEPLPSRRHVLENGVVSNWDAMVDMWGAVFDELQAEPERSPVLITEAPLNPNQNRERMVERLFEELEVPAAQVVHSGVLPLYAAGSRTGLVMEVGAAVAQTVPMFDSYIAFNAVKRLDYGGRDLTDYLARFLREDFGYSPLPHDEVGRRAIQCVKEQLCRVKPNGDLPAGQLQVPSTQKSYRLPDGKVIDCDVAKLQEVAEALFHPDLLQLSHNEEEKGIHQMAFESVSECGRDIQKSLAANIVLSGGSMEFPGMRERVEQELRAMLPVPVKASVVANPRCAAFMGGSIIASMPDIRKNFMTKVEYEENGAAFIHGKTISLTQPPSAR